MLTVLLALLAPAHAQSSPALPGSPTQLVLSGPQMEPSINHALVAYSTPSGAQLNGVFDYLPLSTSPSVIYPGTSFPVRHPEVENGHIASAGWYFPLVGHAELLRPGHTTPGQASTSDQNHRRVTRVSTASGDPTMTWMEMRHDSDGADWNVIAYDKGAGGTLTPLGSQDRGVDQLDPDVWGNVYTWAEENPGTFPHDTDHFQILITDGGSEELVGEGRHPELSKEYVFFEGLDGTAPTIYRAEAHDGSSVSVGSVDMLTGLESDCTSFHRPRTEDEGRFVLYRGEGCGSDNETWLLLADTAHECSYFVDKLPGLHRDLDPAAYDTDGENLIYSKWVGSKTQDYDLFVWSMSGLAEVEKCKP